MLDAPRLHRLLPFLAWRSRLSPSALRDDVLTGMVVALVVVPQALAYAQLAGLPPQAGLYASLLPSIVAALFGASAQLNTGPTALTSLLTAAALAPLAIHGPQELLALAALLALLAGAIQLLLGLFRMGRFADLLSHPILHGFNNACALLICLSQLPALLGLPAGSSRGFGPDLAGLVLSAPTLHLPSAMIGLGSVFALLALRRHAPRWPGVMLVAGAATLAAGAMDFAGNGGRVVGRLSGDVLEFAWPASDWQAAWELLPAAGVVALVSFVEAMASCKAAAARTRQPWDANQELIGQGLAKMVAGWVQAYPVSGSFGRSAILLAGRAHSGVASITGALVVLAVLLAAPQLLANVPRPALAAVVLVTVAALLDPHPLLAAWRARRDDGISGVAALLATLAAAPRVEIGLMASWLLSLALMVYRGMRPRVALLGLHPDGTYRDAARFGLPLIHPAVVILRFDGPLHFVNSATFEEAVMETVRGRPGIRSLLISGAGINEIDATGVETLEQVADRLAANGVELAFCGLKRQVIEVLERTGTWERLGTHAGYRTEDQALAELIPKDRDHPEVNPQSSTSFH